MTANVRLDEAKELLAAASRDQRALTILSRDPAAPTEIALFLGQQAIEKCIKAVLAMSAVVYRRTHDLLLLESLAIGAGVSLPVSHDLLARIGPYAVEFRYLGSSAPVVSLAEAQVAAGAAIAWATAICDEQA
jgi:hypothetical protein